MSVRLKSKGWHWHPLTECSFYKLNSRKRLAKLLLCSFDTLAHLSDGGDLYVRRWKHKKKDIWLKTAPPAEKKESFRPIDIPSHELKRVQGRIAYLLGRIEPPDFLFSPVKRRSYVDNAAHHRGARAFRLLDIANYFPSCTANHIAWFFGKELKCSPDVVAVLVRLTTQHECLPQGSPCSPILAYFSNQKMWRAIHSEVNAYNCKLSVYADDVTISGEMVPGELIWKIKKLIHKQGFRIKAEKESSRLSDLAAVYGFGCENRIFWCLAFAKRLRIPQKS